MKDKPTPEEVAAYYAQMSKPPKPAPSLEFYECECGKEHPEGYVCMQLSSFSDLRT